MPPDEANAWVADGAPLEVHTAGEGQWEHLVATMPVVVTDGGFTEVPPGTVTVAAVRTTRRTAP
jgi:hypothetical protein